MSHFERSVLPLKEIIYLEVRNKILNLDYKPGRMISETEISEMLKVSRTPVREVFIRLSYEKLINIYPQKGTFISLIDLPFVGESVYMRSILECRIINEIFDKSITVLPQEAKKNIRLQEELVQSNGTIQEFLELDNDFHRIIFKTVGHETIWDIISTTKIHYNRYRVLTMYEPEMLRKVYNEHCDLVKYIETSDKRKCGSLLKEHHYSGLDHASVIKEKYPDYFL